jgi:hypothetical protein
MELRELANEILNEQPRAKLQVVHGLLSCHKCTKGWHFVGNTREEAMKKAIREGWRKRLMGDTPETTQTVMVCPECM